VPNPDLEIYAFLQRAPAPEDPTAAKPGTHCTVDYPKAKHHRTTQDFFADELIELVVVCTEHDTHAEFAELSLNAEKRGTRPLKSAGSISIVSGLNPMPSKKSLTL
jgi:predicted dehydrogenase